MHQIVLMKLRMLELERGDVEFILQTCFMIPYSFLSIGILHLLHQKESNSLMSFVLILVRC
jgi:hypothetical protein